MIFVTVGTHNQGFERLVKKMDEIAGQIDDEVVIQVGYTDYEPKNAEWFRFKQYEEILEIIEQSYIVVCHGGAGILLDVLSKNKKTVVVPRLKKYNEVYDDHEIELTNSLKNLNNILLSTEVDSIKEFLIDFKIKKFQKKNLENTKLLNFIKNTISNFDQ